MNQLKRLLIIFCLGLPLMAHAELKMGVVNVPKIMEEAPQAEQARRNLEREFEPRKEQLRKQSDKLVSLENELKKNAAIMSERERRKKERDLITGKRELKRAQEEWREDLALRRNEELGKVMRTIMEAIEGLAKSEQFDVVLGEGVIFARETVDITDKVLQRLKRSNSQSKK